MKLCGCQAEFLLACNLLKSGGASHLRVKQEHLVLSLQIPCLCGCVNEDYVAMRHLQLIHMGKSVLLQHRNDWSW